MNSEKTAVDSGVAATAGSEANAVSSAAQPVSVAIRLQPVEQSQMPVFSNIATVQPGSGVVFIDFGFIDPQTLMHLARLGQPGVEIPQAVSGILACRVVLGLDTIANLANQLNHLLRNATAAQARAGNAGANAPESAAEHAGE
ncbi:hypothetical protein [Accumulibacter sp.]|uniref:hypothetical protein n=1 Tax=Accumulibacter sp. TaxID=2053492 RepID=UPI0025F10790|nr:hypothetical protein [Accumulibacter sp.]MCM8610803.1 hypothetical protein [Accumulibacter sp.]MCM8636411.1 hypothetical protein [Accumulibacter sp.]MCM8640112.1 hypothetical protein [Accumulibacter sp.]